MLPGRARTVGALRRHRTTTRDRRASRGELQPCRRTCALPLRTQNLGSLLLLTSELKHSPWAASARVLRWREKGQPAWEKRSPPLAFEGPSREVEPGGEWPQCTTSRESPMKQKRAQELREAWGDTPCDHPQLAKLYDLGVPTGSFACIQCGS